ncbi:MAG: hypothetical protein WDO68_01465 [Gammaproteobacteria bacterium]
MRRIVVARVAALLTRAHFLANAITAFATGKKCDRECLRGPMDGFLMALTAPDPFRLNIASVVALPPRRQRTTGW